MFPVVKKAIAILLRNKKSVYVVNSVAATHDIENHSVHLKEADTKHACKSVPGRYVIVVIGFLSFAILNAQRVNISIALVAMRNNNIQTNRTTNESDCNSSSKYKTNEHPEKRSSITWHSETEGFIISSSFLGYVLTQIPGGRFSETLGAKQILCFSLFCASLCNILSPLAANWSAFLLMTAQFLKGMAQGFIQPAVSCLMARWYPKEDRSFLSSVTFSGFPAGALFGGIASGSLCDSEFLGGWPAVFYVFGALGMLLMVFVPILVSNSPEESVTVNDSIFERVFSEKEETSKKKIAKTPWFQMFSSLPVLALLIGMFGNCWMNFYFISVHPIYLSSILNFNITENGVFSSLPYILQILVMWFSSAASDRISKKKYATTDTMRKTFNTLSCLIFSASILGVAFAGRSVILNTVCFFIAMSSIGMGYPGCLTVPMDMTINYAGTLMGLSSTFASTSGFVLPVIVGYLTNNQQTLIQWNKMLYISAAVVMGSGIVFHVFGSAELQDWDSESRDTKVKDTENNENSHINTSTIKL